MNNALLEIRYRAPWSSAVPDILRIFFEDRFRGHQ